MKFLKLLIFSIAIVSFVSCKQTDDTPPTLTMNPYDTLGHVLNQMYVDAGATASDDTDGDLTSSIYINNQVNENLAGEYTITYDVVDQAGNEAPTATRWVFVYNTAWIYINYYTVNEQTVFPVIENFQYSNFILADTLVNQRITFSSLAGNLGQTIYADIYDSLIVIPFQIAQYDSLNSYSIQGSGSINDSLIIIEYRKIDSVTSLWNAEISRLK